MENKNEFEIKTITLGDVELEVKFSKVVSVKKMALFIKETELLIRTPKNVSSNKTLQQFFHVMLIIKYFTDVEVDTTSVKTLIQESERMINSGLLEKLIENFDQAVINEINELVMFHHLLIYRKTPTYLSLKDLQGKAIDFSTLKDTEENNRKKTTNELFDQWKFDTINIDPYSSLAQQKFYEFKLYGISNSADVSAEKEPEKELTTDELLDEYSDYMKMYDEFSDIDYLERAKYIMKVLRGEKKYYGI
jgi:hypothetical protein